MTKEEIHKIKNKHPALITTKEHIDLLTNYVVKSCDLCKGVKRVMSLVQYMEIDCPQCKGVGEQEYYKNNLLAD